MQCGCNITQCCAYVCAQEERCKAPLILLASLLPASSVPALRLVGLFPQLPLNAAHIVKCPILRQ